MRRLRFWLNYWRYAHSAHPSWRIVYMAGGVERRSYPLRREDAATRARLFGPARIEYCRDYKGDLVR